MCIEIGHDELLSVNRDIAKIDRLELSGHVSLIC